MEELLRAVADLKVTLDKDFREIVLALTQEPFDVIKDMIHNENPDEGFLKDKDWAIVMDTCLKFDRFSVFEMLLDEGVRPDVVIPGQFCMSTHDRALLQVAVAAGKHAAVQLLLRKNVNVNKVLEHTHQPYVYSPMHCRSIMCPVFSNDDPEMMKLLLDRYDQSCNWDGKCTLYMACITGATKCALSLLKNLQYKEHVNLSDVRLHHIPIFETTLLPILYYMGVKKDIYTSDDLGECLHADINCLDSPIQEPFIADDIELLLGLGAPVNFEVNGKTPLDSLLQRSINVTDLDTEKALVGTLPKAVSLLLHHGARAQFKSVNAFLFSLFLIVLVIHRKGHLRPVLQEPLNFFFKMISLFRKDEFSKQILGSQSPSTSQNQQYFETFLDCPHYETLFKTIVCQSDCSSLLGAIKVCVLDLDITDFVHTLSNIIRIPRSVFCTDRCDCQSLFDWTLMCIWPHKVHQTYIQKLHDSVSTDQCPEIYEHFPFDRSLKDLARVSILSTLCFPRSVSARKLPIPQSVQEYLCLQ